MARAGAACAYRGRTGWQVLGLLLLATVALVATASEASAACTPAAGSNVTATCFSTTTNQGAGIPGTHMGTNGYGAGTETGLAVNVSAGASVTGTDYGIAAGDVTVNNAVGATISGTLDGGISASTGAATVINSGTISGVTNAADGIHALTTATVTNNAGASIIADGYGISAIGGVTLTNYGSISTGFFDAINASGATVINGAGASITSVHEDGINALNGAANVINSGTIASTNASGISGTSAMVTNNVGGRITGFSGIDVAHNVTVINSGTITASSGTGIVGFDIGSTATVTNYSGATISGGLNGIKVDAVLNVNNSGSISGTTGDGLNANQQTVTNNAGGSVTGGRYGIVAFNGNSSITNAGSIGGGTAAIDFGGTGNTLTLLPGSAISGAVLGSGANTLQLAGSGSVSFDASQLGSASTLQYQGFGTLNKLDSSTWTLTGTSPFTGAINVNGGTLAVNGDMRAASSLTINAAGTLAGAGTVGATQVNAGGTFAPGSGTPGSSMTVAGNLAFQSGAIYLVQVNPSASSFANVTGTATLGGAAVNAVFASGGYVSKQYTILTANSVSGTFGSLANTNLPSNFSDTLSYDATHAYLNLTLDFGIPGGLNGNQQAVGNALTNYFNSTGGIPLTYAALSSSQLSQASGESATGSQQTTFQAMGQFLGLLTDPFMSRGGGINGATSTPGYADEETDQASAYAARKRTGREGDAYAMFTKAPLAKVYEPRWSVWVSGFGGSQSTDGNAAVGSNSTTSSIYGTAVGADYLLSPKTVAGFALAGGGTNFSVAGSGGGRSDLFQAGAYVRHTEGAAYLSGALAYGWQDLTTNRTVTIAGLDQLRAEFNANAYSGRVEGGYRFVAPWIGGIGITPYAAGQFTTFDLPAYAESVVSGGGAFALAYSAKSVTDSRSELGLRTDKAFAMTDGIVTLRGRLAWAHDFNPDRSIAATFQALPGASFVVNGAAQAADSALVTAAVEKKWLNGWSAAATFEGEFSDVTRSYAGKAVVRYNW
jgi:uncharacterized protein with beta-barrel porin domain